MHWSKFLRELLDVADKYYLIAGIAFLIFYLLLRKRINWKKIQPKFPAMKDYRREILFSTISIIIFALTPIILLENDYLRPHTTFYKDISRYGWLYFWGVFPLLLLIHDTYFYWMHRLIHHPGIIQTGASCASPVGEPFTVGGVCLSPAGSLSGVADFCRFPFYDSDQQVAFDLVLRDQSGV